jgi:hypothetical protein
MNKPVRLLLMAMLTIALTLGTGQTARAFASPAPVNLLSTGNFAILSETGITNTGSHLTAITGNIGSSSITAAAMNGIWCSEITGKIYGVDAAYTGDGLDTTCFAGNPGVPPVSPPDANKTLVDNAVLDMLTAYNDAAGRTLPDATELGTAGEIGGLTIYPGLYKWGTSVTISTDVTLSGSSTDVWIFQIAGDLSIASGGSVPAGIKVILAGGAQASNIFWQVGGLTGATLGTYSTFNGNLLTAKQIVIQTGAVLNGRALAQTQVTLDGNPVTMPAGTNPGLLFPPNGAILHDNRPTFDWSDFPGAKYYQIQVSRNAAFTQLVVNKYTIAPISSYTPMVSLPANTTLYWRVRAGLPYTPWSEVWNFATANPPSTPTLLSPANNALTTGPSPLFDWTDSTVPVGEAFHHYQIQIATDSGFTNIVHDNDVANSQDNTAILDPATTYYWRVRSWNTDNDSSAWSVVWSVRIKYDTPTLLLPLNGDTVGSLRPTFSWEAVLRASSYTIQISRNAVFTQIIGTINSATNGITSPINLPGGMTFYWRVRANGLFGPSAWSTVFSFTTP